MSIRQAPQERKLRSRRLTAIALALFFLPPIAVTQSASAVSPGNGWATPLNLSYAPYSAFSYDVAADRMGNGMAIYSAYDGYSAVQLYSYGFLGPYGWVGGQQLSEYGPVNTAAIAMNAVGDALAAWSQFNGSAYVLAVAHYTAQWGWTRAQNVSNMTNSTATPIRVAIDGTGVGYVATTAYNGTGYHVYATSVSVNGTPSPQERMDLNLNYSYQVALAAGQPGGAFIAWAEWNGTSNHVHVSRYAPGTGWLPNSIIDIGTNSASFPRLAVDDYGRALLVYQQYGYLSGIQYARYNPGYGWTTPDDTYPYYYGFSEEVKVTPTGIGVLAYYRWNGSSYVVGYQRLLPDGKWYIGPDLAEDLGSNLVQPVRLAIDQAGNGMVLYNKPSPPTNYTVKAAVLGGSGWGAKTFVSDEGSTQNTTDYKVAMLSNNRALAMWREWDGTAWIIRVNKFAGADTIAPWVIITSPITTTVASIPSISVYGYAEPGATVTVNGASASADATGYFVANTPLAEGTNWFYATAEDAAGNWGYSDWTLVTYMNPAPMRSFEPSQAGRSGWQDLARIETMNQGGAWWPTIRSDARGNAVAVWYESAYPGYNHGYAAYYTNGSGWANPVLLQGADYTDLYGAARVVMDPGGNVTIVWVNVDWSRNQANVYVQRYIADYGWYGPWRLNGNLHGAWWPDAALLPNNNVYVAWQERNDTTGAQDIYGQMFTDSWSTSTPRMLLENYTGTTELPRLGFDAAGRGYMVTRTYVSGNYSIAMNRYSPGTGWDNGTLLLSVPNLYFNVPMAVDGGGNLTISWERVINGSYIQLYSGRYLSLSGWTGATLVWNDSWTWDPEVLADNAGYAYVAFTASVNGTANAYASVAAPGGTSGTATLLDNGTLHGGGPKLSKSGVPGYVRVHWDENEGGVFRANMRVYNESNGTWSSTVRLSPETSAGHIPDVTPMADGGFMVLYAEENASIGYNSQIVARRFLPLDLTPPSLSLTTPSNGTVVNVSSVRVTGSTEIGALVFINGAPTFVLANGSFALDVPLMNGTNSIVVVARDVNGNTATQTRSVTFADPNLALINQLQGQNAALQAQLNLTNSSLWSALAGQNASLLGQLAAQNATLAAAIAAGDSALLAQLVAQNTTLQQAIGNLNTSLLASLAAQNASLAAAIAAGDSALLAQLLAQNASLLNQIAGLNASLVASLAAQNSALLANIAATNSSLLAKLAAQNASVMSALGNLNQTLLAQLASQDAELTRLIGDTNASLLAELAAQNDALTNLIANTNSSLLASLAAQNDDLRARITATNATLLASLAAQNTTLQGKIDADRLAAQQANEGQDASISATQGDVASARAAAAGASTMALLGVLIGAAGVGVGALAFLSSRKRPPQIDGPSPVAHVEEVAVVDPAPSGPSRGHSMGAEGELAGKAENEL